MPKQLTTGAEFHPERALGPTHRSNESLCVLEHSNEGRIRQAKDPRVIVSIDEHVKGRPLIEDDPDVSTDIPAWRENIDDSHPDEFPHREFRTNLATGRPKAPISHQAPGTGNAE